MLPLVYTRLQVDDKYNHYCKRILGLNDLLQLIGGKVYLLASLLSLHIYILENHISVHTSFRWESLNLAVQCVHVNRPVVKPYLLILPISADYQTISNKTT